MHRPNNSSVNIEKSFLAKSHLDDKEASLNGYMSIVKQMWG
jgi:hypothetical protein